MSDVFANAATVAPKKVSNKKGDKVEKPLPGLDDYAALKAMIDALSAIAKTFEEQLKEKMAAEFVKEGQKIGRKPESYRGVDTHSSASCELRNRAVTSPLEDEEIKAIEEVGLEKLIGTNIKQVGTFIVNPKYAVDGDLLGKIGPAIAAIPGIPEDFILKQPEVSVKTSTAALLDAIFKLKGKKTADMLKIAGVLALKPKMESDNMDVAFKMVQKFFNTEPEAVSNEPVNPFA